MSLYDHLGVSKGASSEEIKRVYRKRVCANCHRKLHAKRLFLTDDAKTIGSAEIAAALEVRIAATFNDGGKHNERLMRRRKEIMA